MRLIDVNEIKKREHDVILANGAKHRCFDTTRLYEIPTVDAVPVRHGHWIVEWETDDTRMLRCSKCRMIFNVGKGRDGNYCPECGARMDEE